SFLHVVGEIAAEKPSPHGDRERRGGLHVFHDPKKPLKLAWSLNEGFGIYAGVAESPCDEVGVSDRGDPPVPKKRLERLALAVDRRLAQAGIKESFNLVCSLSDGLGWREFWTLCHSLRQRLA